MLSDTYKVFTSLAAMFFIVLHSVLVHLLSLSLAFLKEKKWKEVYEKKQKNKNKKKAKRNTQ